MKDRVPLYPGRVNLTPVSGQENTYDMVRADEPTQEGTPLSKATFLKDATSAMFGLDATSVPDDVFAFLGKYAQYWWRRRQPTTVYTTTESPSTKQVYIIYNPGSTSATRPINYSDSISVDQSTGTISLVNPQTVDVSYSNRDTTVAGTLAGKYVTNLYTDPSTVYKFATTPSYGRDSSRYSLYFSSGDVTVVSSVGTQGYTDWEYLQSNNRNAYPDTGESGGYEYEFLGKPLDNAVTAPKIETGSYIGTETYGASNPNSLTFYFEPKLIVVTTSSELYKGILVLIQGHVGTSTLSSVTTNWLDNGVSWYDDSADKQFNRKIQYGYVAVG